MRSNLSQFALAGLAMIGLGMIAQAQQTQEEQRRLGMQPVQPTPTPPSPTTTEILVVDPSSNLKGITDELLRKVAAQEGSATRRSTLL